MRMIKKLPIKDWHTIEAIGAIIPALNQVIDVLNEQAEKEQASEEWPAWNYSGRLKI